LVEQLKRTNTDLTRLLSVRCSQTSLEGLDISNMRPDALFYQTGYLTIKSYDPEEDIYYLSLPNEEVKQGFFEYILPFYANLGDYDSKVFVLDFRKEIEEGKVDSFMERLQSLFAGISYEMRLEEERSVQNALLILFTLIGMKVDVEYRTSSGRIDILIRTSRFVYIIELKFNRTAQEALQQIKEKEYKLPWNIDDRQVIAIGANFSSELRRINSWESEIL
ncbi:MAG: PD-(D/E)XK nuclease domain-containing protein, partial [Muribaculaceae bacterium]|nr:PD-(D/E)XK nuclease domain-containing protein [Muribaculaceae bacterium]